MRIFFLPFVNSIGNVLFFEKLFGRRKLNAPNVLETVRNEFEIGLMLR